MRSKPALQPARPVPARQQARPPGDIRSPSPAVAWRYPLRAFVRRAASIAALVFLDLTGLTLGLYAALVLREYLYGQTPLWGLLWEGPR